MADALDELMKVLGNVADGMGVAGAPIRGTRAWWRRDEARNLLRDIKRELDERWDDHPTRSDAYEQLARVAHRPELSDAFEAAVEGDTVALDRVRAYLSEHLGSESAASSCAIAEVVAEVVAHRLGRAQRSPEAAIDVVGRRLDENARRRIAALHEEIRALRRDFEAALHYAQRRGQTGGAAFVAHWRPRARGVELAVEPADFFEGRTAALRRVIAWIAGDEPMLVVTGGPGSGKSALLARIVCRAVVMSARRLI
jgi:hypothetical protein